MDSILEDIQSTDTRARLSALERGIEKFRQKSSLSGLQSDVRLKLMTSCINNAKDANPKIVMNSLICMELLITNYSTIFVPLVNMSFDILINKFADSKVAIRSKAIDIIVLLIGIMDFSLAFERILANLGHKNMKVKESILLTIGKLQDKYGEALKTFPKLCKSVVTLLNDPQTIVRRAAEDALIKLYEMFGEKLVNLMEELDIRPAQIEKIRSQGKKIKKSDNMIVKAATMQIHTKNETVMKKTNNILSKTNSGLKPTSFTKPNLNIDTMDTESNYSLEDNQENITSSNRVSTGETKEITKNTGKTPKSRDISPNPTLQRGLLNTNKRSNSAAPMRSSANVNATPNFGSTSPASFSTAGTNSTGDSSNRNSGIPASSPLSQQNQYNSVFDPYYFMPVIFPENGELNPIIVENEKDLGKMLGKITVGLRNTEDWQERINAMMSLQSILWGRVSGSSAVLTQWLKENIETLNNQVADLRSVVSKEACRTVALLAYTQRNHLSPLLELIWSKLVKLVVIKIQLLSSAANRCLRVLTVSCEDSRFLNVMLDSTKSKSPLVRRLTMEFCCLACATWKTDVLERNLTHFRDVIRVVLGDADPGARKSRPLHVLDLNETLELKSNSTTKH